MYEITVTRLGKTFRQIQYAVASVFIIPAFENLFTNPDKSGAVKSNLGIEIFFKGGCGSYYFKMDPGV